MVVNILSSLTSLIAVRVSGRGQFLIFRLEELLYRSILGAVVDYSGIAVSAMTTMTLDLGGVLHL